MLGSGLVLTSAVFVSALTLYKILRSPAAPGRLALALSGLFSIWWITTVMLRLNVDGLNLKILLCELAWFGILGTPLFWSIGFLDYAGYTKAGRPRNFALAIIITLVGGIAALTNEFHQAIYTGITDIHRPSFSHGWLYFLLLVIVYVSLSAASTAALMRLKRSSGLHRLQFTGVLAAMALPWIANFAFNTFEFRILNDDPTPFAFAATSFIMLMLHSKAKLFTAPPVARDVIFAILPDPVIVLDAENVILELNPAAEQHAGLGEKPIGKRLPNDHPLQSLSKDGLDQLQHHQLIHLNNNTRTFEVSQRSLDQWDRKGCRLLVLRDVTTREAAKQKLVAVGIDLQNRLEENLRLQKQLQDEATHDHLTGLFNRRHAQTAASALLKKASKAEPASVILFDLDFFKQINDRFGHDVGDKVLVEFAQILQTSLSHGEMAFRHGGEEFLMVLPGTSSEKALRLCNLLRRKLKQANIPETEDFDLSFSAGIAPAPLAGTTLGDCVKAADIALYRAKISGRNQDIVWGNHLTGMAGNGSNAKAAPVPANRVA